MFKKSYVGLENYKTAITQYDFLKALGWTLFITVLSVAVILICCSMTAWFITCVKNVFTKNYLPLMCVFYGYTVPDGYVYTFRNGRLLHLNTPWGIVIVYLGFGAGLAVFMFTGFVKSIPIEVEEAAMMDGCSPLRTFFCVVVPMMKPTFITDDIAAGKCAVDALLEAGHDKIGIIGGDPVKSYTSHQRYLGCKESFAEHGKEMDLEVCYEKARFSFDSAYRAMKRLVEKYPDLTAVFAMSDVMAIGAIRALRDMDYRVPEDISVIGFDGTVLAEYYNPKLATIRQQYQTLAVRSVEILFGQIELKKRTDL